MELNETVLFPGNEQMHLVLITEVDWSSFTLWVFGSASVYHYKEMVVDVEASFFDWNGFCTRESFFLVSLSSVVSLDGRPLFLGCESFLSRSASEGNTKIFGIPAIHQPEFTTATSMK